MARVVKQHVVRREEILDSARRFIYGKGYEQMTIQDILADLQIAKGTFYHYFNSKQALLDAVIDRMQLEIKQILLPLADDTSKSALDKLAVIFDTSNQWKTEHKTFALDLLRSWHTDENVLVRDKARIAASAWLVPLIADITRQGIQEGVFNTQHPDFVGAILIELGLWLSEVFVHALLSDDLTDVRQARIESAVGAYNDGLERLLGAPTGSIRVVDPITIQEWVEAVGTHA